MNSEITDSDVSDFYQNISNWGSQDIVRAIEIYKEVGSTAEDLAEEIKEFSDSCETPLEKIDICYVAYDSILQQARNKIREVLDFDFMNDGADINIYGNYLCTSYDYTQENQDKLKEVLEKATDEQKGELRSDKVLVWFVEKIELGETIK